METTCHYHPLQISTFYCRNCDISCCDACVNDARQHARERCFHCNREVESTGPGNIEPFWRRLPQSFRYPLTTQSLVFIIGLSVLCVIARYMPFAVFIYLGLFGTGFKYSLSCLRHTAEGHMSPPDITEAYEGGLQSMLVLIVLLFIMGLVSNLTHSYLGPAVGGLVALLMTMAFPAIIINYAISESMLEAINPRNISHLMSAVGLPYGLILAFIMIMLGSMAVVYQLALWVPGGLVGIFLFSVTFYYLVVLHHLLGYVVFQYQGDLGFNARLQDDNSQRRDDQAIARAETAVRLRSADFAGAAALYARQLQMDDGNFERSNQYFELLLATNDVSAMSDFLPQYGALLDSRGREDLLSRNFKRLLLKNPGFTLNDPALKWRLAQACFRHNNPQVTIKLLHGIHKQHPDFPELIPALNMLATALDEYPKYANHAQACRKLITRLTD
jgi:hypothetical protein